MHLLIKLLCTLFLSAPLCAQAAEPILFVGDDSMTGEQLWKTDHTAQQTQVLTYLTQTPNASSYPYPLGNLGQWGIFAAFSPETGTELWRTDGTPQGTTLLKDLVAGTKSSLDFPLLNRASAVTVNNHLLFWGSSGNNLILISTDGTPDNTQIIKTFPLNENNERLNRVFYALGNYQFFWSDDGKQGVELWRTDGTHAGTQLVVDATQELPNITEPRSFEPKAVTNGTTLYFMSLDTLGHYEDKVTQSLWATDGNKTERLYTFTEPQIAPAQLIAANSHYIIYRLGYFSKNTAFPPLELFNLATRKVQSLKTSQQAPVDAMNVTIQEAQFWKDALYLWTVDEDHNQLWQVDLNAHTIKKVISLIDPSPEHTNNPRFFLFANRLYFFIMDGSRPSQLWFTDGTTQGTQKLVDSPENGKDLFIGQTWSDLPTPYVIRGDYLIFPTFSAKGGEFVQLWSISQTNPTKPVLLGEFTNPYLLRPAPSDNDKLLYFISDKQRFQTDGTKLGTKILGTEPLMHENTLSVDNLLALPTNLPSWLAKYQDIKVGAEPWLITTAPKTNQLLKDINTHPAPSRLGALQSAQGDWYFTLEDQWWFSDGTSTNTHPVNGINKNEKLPLDFYVSAQKGKVFYFLTQNNQQLFSLWQAEKGQAKRLNINLESKKVRIFTSQQGLYILSYPKKGGYELSKWQNETLTPVMSHPQKRMDYLLETPDGIVYVLDHPLNVMKDEEAMLPTLWLRPTNNKPDILLSSEAMIDDALTLSKDFILPTQHQVYSKHMDFQADDVSYLYRIDFKNQKLQPIKLTFGENTAYDFTILASPQGLFISARLENKGNELWFLPETTEQMTLLKAFPTEVELKPIQVINNTLYFNVRSNTQKTSDTSALWSSEGTPNSAREIKQGVTMLRRP